MPQQSVPSLENNFTKGLITETTGLNFPEHASTDTDNCTYTLIGDVTRRLGFDKEINGASLGVPRTGFAISDYKWDNAGGDSFTQLVVRQVGNALNFYRSSSATTSLPLSQNRLASFVDCANFVAAGNTLDTTKECQYSSGNGFLFVYHPSCDPFYVDYNAGTLTGHRIAVKIRDFNGVIDSLPTETRPLTLSAQHQYNLVNQGWVKGSPWDVSSGSVATVATGAQVFFIGAGIVGITLGQQVRILYETGGTLVAPSDTPVMAGTVTAYAAGNITINVTSTTAVYNGKIGTGWRIQPTSSGYIDTWFAAVGNYPSNADVWWYFKNASGVFDPATTNQNVTVSTGNGPRGHFIFDAFNAQRSSTSGISGLTPVQTTLRPKTGTWFQGRVWYTGVDASQAASGDANQYSWSENIYFSQVITDVSQFGNCFQQNDPTSENLFDLLPTDGGVITIQGSGSIYQLFPVQNGLIVFAGNGIWFITGSQGIGFTANDYTITRISSTQSISCTSYVNVNGFPYFWNEEGIYSVLPSQGGGFEVSPITLGTILSLYSEIPVACKKLARGAYHPVDYIIQWVYRDTDGSDLTSKYSFNKILNYSTANKAFFPYTINNTNANLNGVIYVNYPGGSTAPLPGFKYPATITAGLTYADEHDEDYVDWQTGLASSVNYESYFITGYKLKGQLLKKFQPQYILMYSRTNDELSQYKIQSIWDYSNNRSSGRWSSQQLVTNGNIRYDVIMRRHRIRGHGYACQIKVTSIDGMPFDIIGWASTDMVNAGI